MSKKIVTSKKVVAEKKISFIKLEGKVAWEMDSSWLYLPPEWCKEHLGGQPNFTWLLVSNAKYTFLCRPLPIKPFPLPTIIPTKFYLPENKREELELKWGTEEVQEFQVKVVEKLRICTSLKVELDDFAWTEQDWVILNCALHKTPVRPALQVTCTGKSFVYKMRVLNVYHKDELVEDEWMLVTKETKLEIRKSTGVELETGLELVVAGPKGIGKTFYVENFVKNSPIIPITKTEELELATKHAVLLSKQTDGQIVLLIKNLDTLAPRDAKGDQLDFVNALIELPSYITVFGCVTNIADICPRLKFRNKHLMRAPEELLPVFKGFWPFKFEIPATVEYFVDQRIRGYLPGDLEKVMEYAIVRIDPIIQTKQPSEDELISIFKEALAVNPPTLLKGYRIQGTDFGVSWDQLGGLFKVKPLLERYVEWPLTRASQMKVIGLRPPRGILLHGPPGCSKTCIAKAIASKNAFTFCTLDVADIFSAYVGESERLIRQVFAQARLTQPSIVFVDEIDALVGKRDFGSGGGDVVQERVLTTFLTEMDGVGGVEDDERVMVLAATNRLAALDPAITRPGRFDVIIHVDLPNKEERIHILKTFAKGSSVIIDDDALEWAANRADGWSGAELKDLFRTAMSLSGGECVTLPLMSDGFDKVIRTRNKR